MSHAWKVLIEWTVAAMLTAASCTATLYGEARGLAVDAPNIATVTACLSR